MGLATISPAKYGKLCARVIPKVIQSEKEFNRMVEEIEALDRKANPTPEENALSELLMKLIQDYDDANYSLPDVAPTRWCNF